MKTKLLTYLSSLLISLGLSGLIELALGLHISTLDNFFYVLIGTAIAWGLFELFNAAYKQYKKDN
jgi:uncharacterized membrane protein YuzA (DUF378 family)